MTVVPSHSKSMAQPSQKHMCSPFPQIEYPVCQHPLLHRDMVFPCTNPLLKPPFPASVWQHSIFRQGQLLTDSSWNINGSGMKNSPQMSSGWGGEEMGLHHGVNFQRPLPLSSGQLDQHMTVSSHSAPSRLGQSVVSVCWAAEWSAKSAARISWPGTPLGVGLEMGVRRSLVLLKVWAHT